jgi:hypothetical protein
MVTRARGRSIGFADPPSMYRERDVAILRVGHFVRAPRRLPSPPTLNPHRSILSDNPTEPAMACRPAVSAPSALAPAPHHRLVSARSLSRGGAACPLRSSSAGSLRLGARRAPAAAFVVRAAVAEVRRTRACSPSTRPCINRCSSVLASLCVVFEFALLCCCCSRVTWSSRPR